MDIAAAMNLLDNEVPFLRECAESTVESLDAPLSDSEDAGTLGDAVGSSDPGFAEVETRVSVEQLLSHLCEVEREVIRFRYGLDDGVEMSLWAVGKRVGKSHEWVSKIEKAAVAKMRKCEN